MKGNDLEAGLTRRYLVTAETVLLKDVTTNSISKGWFSKHLHSRDIWMPDMGMLSKLWRWSASGGIRLELVFIGEMSKDAVQIWDMLDKGSANPFNDWHIYENHEALARILPYRPDILGVICPGAGSSAMYGGKGITMEWLT